MMEQFPPIYGVVLYFGSPFAAVAWMITIAAWRNLGHLDNRSRKIWLTCAVYAVLWTATAWYIRSIL